jgi:predicted GIY-YIG superfamily endonuclease
MPDYSKGKVYRLLCDDPNLVYYGSTVQRLNARLKSHKSNCNDCSSKRLVAVGGVRIELVENYPCNSKAELELQEKYYIQSNKCVNVLGQVKLVDMTEKKQSLENDVLDIREKYKIEKWFRRKHFWDD